MVIVRVGDEDSTDFVFIFNDVGEIWDDDIDTVMLFVREGDSAIHDDDVVFGFDEGAVFTNFTGSTEGNDFN